MITVTVKKVSNLKTRLCTRCSGLAGSRSRSGR
jgi:hypothetical protein